MGELSRVNQPQKSLSIYNMPNTSEWDYENIRQTINGSSAYSYICSSIHNNCNAMVVYFVVEGSRNKFFRDKFTHVIFFSEEEIRNSEEERRQPRWSIKIRKSLLVLIVWPRTDTLNRQPMLEATGNVLIVNSLSMLTFPKIKMILLQAATSTTLMHSMTYLIW